jgi:hypothetical protein
MGEKFHPSGKPTGFQYGNQKKYAINKTNMNDVDPKPKGKDDDLVIEENTIYEIDRDCYERLKKQKRR